MAKSQQPSYTSKVEQVTPALAARMLQKVHSRQQGRHYKNTINKYAAEMAQGGWDTNVPQSIDISVEGELLNGFHRLHAIVKSGVTIPFTVNRNVPATAFANMDAGRSRSLAFRCGLDTETSALASRLVSVCFAATPHRGAACTPSELEVALDFIRPELEVFVANISTTKRKSVTQAAVRLACILRMKSNPTSTAYIVEQFRCLQQLQFAQATPVVNALYRRLSDGDERDKNRVFALAWLAFDPARQGNQKLQLTDMMSTIGDAQRTVLKPLMQLLEAE